jgi:hypothetical protein
MNRKSSVIQGLASGAFRMPQWSNDHCYGCNRSATLSTPHAWDCCQCQFYSLNLSGNHLYRAALSAQATKHNEEVQNFTRNS